MNKFIMILFLFVAAPALANVNAEAYERTWKLAAMDVISEQTDTDRELVKYCAAVFVARMLPHSARHSAEYGVTVDNAETYRPNMAKAIREACTA